MATTATHGEQLEQVLQALNRAGPLGPNAAGVLLAETGLPYQQLLHLLGELTARRHVHVRMNHGTLATAHLIMPGMGRPSWGEALPLVEERRKQSPPAAVHPPPAQPRTPKPKAASPAPEAAEDERVRAVLRAHGGTLARSDVELEEQIASESGLDVETVECVLTRLSARGRLELVTSLGVYQRASLKTRVATTPEPAGVEKKYRRPSQRLSWNGRTIQVSAALLDILRYLWRHGRHFEGTGSELAQHIDGPGRAQLAAEIREAPRCLLQVKMANPRRLKSLTLAPDVEFVDGQLVLHEKTGLEWLTLLYPEFQRLPALPAQAIGVLPAEPEPPATDIVAAAEPGQVVRRRRPKPKPQRLKFKPGDRQLSPTFLVEELLDRYHGHLGPFQDLGEQLAQFLDVSPEYLFKLLKGRRGIKVMPNGHPQSIAAIVRI